VDDFLASVLQYARLWSILRPTYGQKWKTAWERFYVTPREIVAKPFASQRFKPKCEMRLSQNR
jgi:hypothetical protein